MFTFGYHHASEEEKCAVSSRRRLRLHNGDKVVAIDYQPYGIPDGIVGGILCDYHKGDYYATIDYSNRNTFHQIRVPVKDIKGLKRGEDFV